MKHRERSRRPNSQEEHTTMDSPFSSAPVSAPAPEGGGTWKFIVLLVAVLALAGGGVYLYMQIGDMRTELAQTRDELVTQINNIHETSSVTSQTNKRSVDSLKKEVQAARQAANALAGEAKEEATKHADELASKLQAAQAEQAKQVAAV